MLDFLIMMAVIALIFVAATVVVALLAGSLLKVREAILPSSRRWSWRSTSPSARPDRPGIRLPSGRGAFGSPFSLAVPSINKIPIIYWF